MTGGAYCCRGHDEKGAEGEHSRCRESVSEAEMQGRTETVSEEVRSPDTGEACGDLRH